MTKVPKCIPRGVFTEGDDFKKMKSACIHSYRKRYERAMRKVITEEMNKVRNNISKVKVTDVDIQVFDYKNNLIFEM